MGDQVRVRSLNPLRDAATIGLAIDLPRAAATVRATRLRDRFTALCAEANRASDSQDGWATTEDLLVLTRWCVQAIDDNLSTLAAMHEAPTRRDELLRSATDELFALAELSSPMMLADGAWTFALTTLRARSEAMIAGEATSPAAIATDVLLERLERAEAIAAEALRTFLDEVANDV